MTSVDMDHDSDGVEDLDSDRTEVYTPPPLEMTIDFQLEDKENATRSESEPIKDVSVVVLDDSDEQTAARISIPLSPAKLDRSPPNPIETYWDQWPLNNPEIDDDQLKRIYSIPHMDIPSSPQKPSPPRLCFTHTELIKDLSMPTSVSQITAISHEKTKKTAAKSKKKKKPMSEYRPPSPFSPKPDYKSMEIEKLKSLGSRYGLSTNLSKGRLIKILDEIYNFTHQYETDTDFEFDIDAPVQPWDKRELNRTPPTPAALPSLKKVKKRPAIHQMSSSDENEESLKRLSPEKQSKSDDHGSNTADSENEGRFLELTVYELSSSSTSSNSPSITDVSPAVSLNLQKNGSDGSPILISSQQSSNKMIKSQINDSTPNLGAGPEKRTKKETTKRIKLTTPTVPLKEIVRNYIKSNPNLHGRVLCYEPIDFEEFYKQMKNDLNLKIASKEVMQCLDDQCITFTLRAKNRAFTSVMRAKRRQK